MTDSPGSSNNLSQSGTGVQSAGSGLDALERHLASLHDQVRKLQRLASLGTMSAMLAHEFNNMLTPVISYADYALQSSDPAMMRTALEKTLKNARRLTDLSGRVLGLAVEEQMGAVDAPLEPLIRDAVECLGRSLEKDNISLAIDVTSGLSAHVHAGSFRQVLFNLILNARQAMLDRRGTLRIAARPVGSDRVEIVVSDTGPGIRPEHLERIFEPFFSTKEHQDRPDRRGTGLGLSICRQIMEQQGGTIAVSSRYGEGATFTLTLPAAQEAAASQS